MPPRHLQVVVHRTVHADRERCGSGRRMQRPPASALRAAKAPWRTLPAISLLPHPPTGRGSVRPALTRPPTLPRTLANAHTRCQLTSAASSPPPVCSLAAPFQADPSLPPRHSAARPGQGRRGTEAASAAAQGTGDEGGDGEVKKGGPRELKRGAAAGPVTVSCCLHLHG